MSSDGARSMCCPLNCSSLYHVSKSLLNTLWIARSSSWNAPYPIFFEILKGLYLFWSNFFKGQFKWIFLASNYILSPFFNPCEFHLFLSNCFFMASFAISIDFFTTSQLFCSPSRKSSSFGNSVLTVRSPFYGYLPKFNTVVTTRHKVQQ